MELILHLFELERSLWIQIFTPFCLGQKIAGEVWPGLYVCSFTYFGIVQVLCDCQILAELLWPFLLGLLRRCQTVSCGAGRLLGGFSFLVLGEGLHLTLLLLMLLRLQHQLDLRLSQLVFCALFYLLLTTFNLDVSLVVFYNHF